LLDEFYSTDERMAILMILAFPKEFVQVQHVGTSTDHSKKCFEVVFLCPLL